MNDTLHGTFNEWYTNGNKKSVGAYNKGEKVGSWIEFYKNGKQLRDIEYKEGIEYLWNLWSEDGMQVIKNGYGKMLLTYDNGHKLGEGIYRGGLKDSTWVFLTITGKLDFREDFKLGKKNGPSCHYFENGKKSFEGAYLNDQKTGLWFWYKKDSSVEMQGYFLDDKRTGHWQYWFVDSQQKQMDGWYKFDKEDSIWSFWYPNAQLYKTGEFKNGMKNGFWNFYFEKGQKVQEGIYIDNKENGPWSSWYENGQLKDQGAFELGQMVGEWIGFYETGKPNYKGSFWGSERWQMAILVDQWKSTSVRKI